MIAAVAAQAHAALSQTPPPTQIPGQAAANQAPATPPEDLDGQVQVFKQVAALGLTPQQIGDIFGRLSQLSALDANARKTTAVASAAVAEELKRIDAALLAGAASDPADEARVAAAMAQSHAQAAYLTQLRKDTAVTIAHELTTAQLQAVRSFVGMEAAPPGQPAVAANGGAQPGTTGGVGQQPQGGGDGNAGGGVAGAPGFNGGGAAAGPSVTGGGAAGGPGFGRGGAAGGGMFGGGGGFFGAAGPPTTPEEMQARLLDRLRVIPQEVLDPIMGRMAPRIMTSIGLDPNSAEAVGVQQAFSSQLDQARQMSDEEWKLNRTQAAKNLLQQIKIVAPDANFSGVLNTLGSGAAGTRAAIDSEAVRRFFLQRDVLQYLQARVATATTKN